MKKLMLKLQYFVQFLKTPLVLPYVGIVIVLASTFHIHPSGDTQALLTGVSHALSCLSDSPMRVPCGAAVVHFPIFQYLLGVPLALIGFGNASIMTIFGLMSVAWSLIACAAFWRAGFLSAAKRGGHFGVLVLLSGYLLWYMTSPFNEATSFTLFSLLALSVIDRWRIANVCVVVFACTITKEVAFPFVLYFMFLSFLAREMRADQPANLIDRFFQFFDHYKFAIVSVVAGIALNLAFNYFRFGSYRNLGLIAPELFTPWEYVPSFLSYLFVSPAGGLLFTWLSLCVLLIVPLVFFVRDRSAFFIVGFSLLGLVGANLGLAMWFSPFGWYAWGPRLTLPFLGAIGILGVYLIVPHLIKYIHGAGKKNNGLIAIFFIVAASSLPNIAARIDEGAFFSKMFAPTRVAIDSGIKSFTVQSAPAKIYMESSLEGIARNIVIPTTIEVTLKYWPIILLWLLSLFYICRQLIVPGGSSSAVVADAPAPEYMYSGSGTVHNDSIPSTGPSRALAATLCVLFLLTGSTLIARTPFTGDEPRYLYYSASFYEQGDFHLPIGQWNNFLAKQHPSVLVANQLQGDGRGVVIENGGAPAHSVALPVLASPLTGLLSSIPAGRALSLLMALATLCITYDLLLLLGVGRTAALLATCLGAFSLPFMPFSGVFYPEVSLALGVAIGWRLLYSALKWPQTALLILVVATLPFLHLRGLAGSFVLAALFLWRVQKIDNRSLRLKTIALALLLWVIASAIYLYTSLVLYGHFLGAVSTARPSFSANTLNELLVNYRHGLLIYSPIFIFSLVGLISAAGRNVRTAYEGLLFLVFIVFVSLGPNPGESPPARFMVQAVPVLIVGLALWLAQFRQNDLFVRVLFLFALTWSVANSFYYVAKPFSFFANRSTCQTCLDLMSRVGWGGATAEYRVIGPQESLVKGLDNFPAKLSLAEIQVELSVAENLVEVSVLAPDGLGQWTSRPINHLWGIGIIDKEGGYRIRNEGPRREKLNLPISHTLTLWIPDNGNLSKCRDLDIELLFESGKRMSTSAGCKGGGDSTQTVATPHVTGTRIKYQLISPQERLVKNLDNFPATHSLAEIHVETKEVGNFASIGVFAPDGLGQWTSRPISHLWGIGIIDKEGGYKIRNEGPRKENLNLPIIRTLTLWIPDNGNLSKCPELAVILSLVDGTTHNYVAQCK